MGRGTDFFFSIKKWGVEGEKYKTSVSPHLQILLHSSPSVKKKKRKKKEKETKQETFILLENSSMLHTTERKGVGWGWTQYKFPTRNISPLSGVLLEPFSANLPSVLSRSCPSHPSEPHDSACSLSAAPPLSSAEPLECWAERVGREPLQEKGAGYMETICGGAMTPPLPGADDPLGRRGAPAVDVSLPPSCSCCMPTCWSETSAEWRRSGCAVRCHSAERERGDERFQSFTADSSDAAAAFKHCSSALSTSHAHTHAHPHKFPHIDTRMCGYPMLEINFLAYLPRTGKHYLPSKKNLCHPS